ncbi:hypothetical protein P9112_009568 [Eukaryota sp. TZLM1-RC]
MSALQLSEVRHHDSQQKLFKQFQGRVPACLQQENIPMPYAYLYSSEPKPSPSNPRSGGCTYCHKGGSKIWWTHGIEECKQPGCHWSKVPEKLRFSEEKAIVSIYPDHAVIEPHLPNGLQLTTPHLKASITLCESAQTFTLSVHPPSLINTVVNDVYLSPQHNTSNLFDLCTALITYIPSQQSEYPTIKRTLLQFHHIKSKKKKTKIHTWAKELNIIGGFFHFKTLYYIIAQGTDSNVDLFVSNLRSLSWQYMKVIGSKDDVRSIGCAVDGFVEMHFNDGQAFESLMQSYWDQNWNLNIVCGE